MTINNYYVTCIMCICLAYTCTCMYQSSVKNSGGVLALQAAVHRWHCTSVPDHDISLVSLEVWRHRGSCGVAQQGGCLAYRHH